MTSGQIPRRARACLATALVAAALLLLSAGSSPAPASAAGVRGRRSSFQPFFQYTVSFVGSGAYSVTESNGAGGTLTVQASFDWKSVYPNVLVPTTSSSPLGSVGFPAYGLGQEGSGKWKITNVGSEGEDCSNNGALGLMSEAGGGGGGGVKVHRSGLGAGSGVVFELQALTEFATTSGAGDGALPCDPQSFWHDWVVSFTGVGYKHTASGLRDVQPLTGTVKLAPGDLRHGTVTKHVSIGAAEQVPSSCGGGGGSTCTQSYTWSGSVRFTKHKLKAG